MKRVYAIILCFTVFTNLSLSAQEESSSRINQLIGKWKIDLSPYDKSDSNYAIMIIDRVSKNSIEGTFYREGVSIREGRINVQNKNIYGALVSGDNSGDYNTSFYLKNGKLYGSTHSLKKDFLAVWEAVKETK
ncbi:hypothetical protein [Tenacibaculum agarivorans]|uniref:hypothetical protein n=1 Tax=Tenacibaculum agarivorans TaxID=1908389 RepID=UPI00094B9189|nr:hypothetical protein [Tenacibaculum agarivorans]